MPSINVPPLAPLILALDTSSSLGSVALARGGMILRACAFQADHGHSQRLLPAIETLFEDAQLQISEVDLFAVVIGPGSFTGLRVSLACVRGLAGGKPCFGAISTDVVAWACRGRVHGPTILAITDLFHGEVFGSVHDTEGALISARESGELSSVMAALVDRLAGNTVAGGSATLKHRAAIEAACPHVVFVDLPEGLAPHLATFASAQAAGTTTCPAGDLLPFYLRDPTTRGLLNTLPKRLDPAPKE